MPSRTESSTDWPPSTKLVLTVVTAAAAFTAATFIVLLTSVLTATHTIVKREIWFGNEEQLQRCLVSDPSLMVLRHLAIPLFILAGVAIPIAHSYYVRLRTDYRLDQAAGISNAPVLRILQTSRYILYGTALLMIAATVLAVVVWGEGASIGMFCHDIQTSF